MSLFFRRILHLAPACVLAVAAVWAETPGEGTATGTVPPSGHTDVSPQPGKPLSRVDEIFRLPRHIAAQELAVAVEGVVLCGRPNGSFFLHDGMMGIYVAPSAAGEKLQHGDRVRVVGVSRPGVYSPSITPSQIFHLGAGALPEPRATSYDIVASGSTDSQWLEVAGVVWSVEFSGEGQYVILELAMRGGHLRVLVRKPPAQLPVHLLDAEVTIRGVATGNFNRQGQIVSPLLRVPDLSLVSIRRPANPDPLAAPLQPLATLLGFSLEETRLHRVRIQGIVTRRISENVFFVRDQGRGLRVETHGLAAVHAGDRVEAVGFPTMAGGTAVLRNAVIRILSTGEPVAPVEAALATLLDGTHNSDLVRVQARLLDWTGEDRQLTLILQREDKLFRGVLRWLERDRLELPEKNSLLDLTGVCVNVGGNDWRFRGPPSFSLLLASPDDIRVVRRPPWWTAERLWGAVGLLFLVLLAAAAWVSSLRRQVRRKRSVIEEQARRAAVLEERGRIARELHDTLEQGLTGLSLQLSAVETDLRATAHPARSRLEQALRMLSQSRAISRSTIRELRTDAAFVHDESLADGLQRMANLWNESGAVTVQLNLAPPPHPLPPLVEHDLLGIVTEAVTNAVKHGAAGSVRIELAANDHGIEVRVKDDGRGFDPSDATSLRADCYGLIGMQERARRIGGVLEVRSRPGQGTEISITVPDDLERGPAPMPAAVAGKNGGAA